MAAKDDVAMVPASIASHFWAAVEDCLTQFSQFRTGPSCSNRDGILARTAKCSPHRLSRAIVRGHDPITPNLGTSPASSPKTIYVCTGINPSTANCCVKMSWPESNAPLQSCSQAGKLRRVCSRGAYTLNFRFSAWPSRRFSSLYLNIATTRD
jgi:hypothetical protein